ncbi:MAG: LysM peptidoglycan-binding domain-containing protein [Acidimicrobiia bacterium]|nr:LysM peptidoglycan-binding domain-containing protein [Acidimicrobiia bacterium]
MAVAVVFGLLLAVRSSQGAPPATTWAELGDDSRAPVQALAGPGDQLVVAEPGDTYWSVATELAPGADPRPIVDALIAANGGTNRIDIGQRIVVPAAVIPDAVIPDDR